MAAKTDKKPNNPLPVNTDDLTPSSNITYNNEVVAIIAGLAANEIEGIAGMCNVSGSLMSKNRNVTKGVKVEVGSEEVAVDLYVIVEYGIPIQRAAADAQETGLYALFKFALRTGRNKLYIPMKPGVVGCIPLH